MKTIITNPNAVYVWISVAIVSIEGALDCMKRARDSFLKAINRCRNCGKPIDSYPCPYCEWEPE